MLHAILLLVPAPPSQVSRVLSTPQVQGPPAELPPSLNSWACSPFGAKDNARTVGRSHERRNTQKGGNVFIELMPLLAGRTVLITVAKVDDKTLRVNVIPHGKADENPALATPLTYTGSPEELDAELGKHLASYVQVHQQAASTLAEAKATIEAAAKAAQEE